MAENPNIKMRASAAGEKAKNDQLHGALSKWASDDMKFHAQSGFKLPSQEDFKFLCSGPLVDVWKYVTKHVKSVQTAQLVKGNVELQRRIVEPCRSEDAEERERRQALRQHRSRVARNLAQARGDLAQLRRELGHATQELAAAG
ncbi:hypothetical protein EGW08_014243 [Elysia chlorotica]|uniref:Uncharacterized protein n=1 Tax=Elysia chlorotica TaxID=188477 RepID=A0A433T8R8_ELYCH|nr:hypothetical protein EGW08_014243 [Elysia chlorotica]